LVVVFPLNSFNFRASKSISFQKLIRTVEAILRIRKLNTILKKKRKENTSEQIRIDDLFFNSLK